jgi:hypothetical protein
MTSLGASSDNLIMNADTDFGPRVSLLLNSLLLRSLWHIRADRCIHKYDSRLPQYLVGQLRIVILLRQNVEKLSHRLCEMLKIRKILNDRGLRS